MKEMIDNFLYYVNDYRKHRGWYRSYRKNEFLYPKKK